jgi:hypothetical protein
MMHILPSSKIPFSKVPIDTMIANKLTFLKKLDKRMRDHSTNFAVKDHKFVHKNE